MPVRELRVHAGVIGSDTECGFRILSPGVRADVGTEPLRALELRFVYRGPTERDEPLASGERRRQIGIRLRARDTCNVVYVMWHIEPTSGIHVSVKHNIGQSRHEDCRDHGYTTVEASSAQSPRALEVGEPRTLRAVLEERALRVFVDGSLVWTGEVPAAALDFDGPAGFRSDNGGFDVQVLSPAFRDPPVR